jgi:hypothetical protein
MHWPMEAASVEKLENLSLDSILVRSIIRLIHFLNLLKITSLKITSIYTDDVHKLNLMISL